LEVDGAAVDHADVGSGVHDGGGAGERAGGEQIVGREQHGVFGGGPPDQALVVGGDVAVVGLVAAEADAAIGGGELAGDRGGVVGGGVVDDEDAHLDAGLGEDAVHA